MSNHIYSTVEIDGRMITVRRRPPAQPVEQPDEVDYNALTKSALIALAKESGIEVSSRMTKAKIINALEGDD